MPEKYTILYIDDEKINLENFHLAFYRKYNVVTTLSALDAFEILQNQEVHVIISDQRMPKMTGVEFFGKVKNQYPDIIRIILTAYTNENDVLNAINKGEVYRYITKPWKRQDVEITLDNALEAYNLKHRNQALVRSLQEQNKALEENEKRYRLLYETANDAILLLKDDIIMEANSISHTMFRCEPNDLIGLPLHRLFPENQPDGTVSRDLSLKKLSIVKGGRTKIFEWQYRRFDGSLFYSEVSLNSLLLNEEVFVLAIIRDITDRKYVEKKLLETIIQTEEKERMRFAQDLHDEVGPLLSSLKMYLSTLSEIKDTQKLNTFINMCLSLITETIATVRRTSNALSPHILNNFGLRTAIESLLENTGNLIKVEFYSDITKERFQSNTEIVYYRILKELINNTLKHAKAGLINIELTYDRKDHVLVLLYKDDGVGFDFDREIEKKTGGIGLLNILNRAKTIGGNYKFIKNKEKGVEFVLKTNADTF
ncbi:MAG: response regulator [Bacteroidota bacterium]